MMFLLFLKSLSVEIMRMYTVYKELCFHRMKESYIIQIKQFNYNSQIPL